LESEKKAEELQDKKKRIEKKIQTTFLRDKTELE